MKNYLDLNDSIIALATADGLASIAVIRISGENLKRFYKKISNKKKLPKKNSINFNKIYSPLTKEHLDDGLIAYFETPNSFTGESVIEINCHGGNYVASKIIEHCVNSGLVRHALPGEFSFRAFYNGKIDLIQAESINDLISSESNIYAEKSLNNINGELSKKIENIRSKTISIMMLIEHELDFNENEIDFTKNKTILENLNFILSEIQKIESSFIHSKIIRNGIRILLLGKPNVGKSSLFNYLVGEKRAIVSNISGTTRDSIETVFEIDGYRASLIDSAGVIKSKDVLERVAVKKTEEEISLAHIIIVLAESPKELNNYDHLIKDKKSIKVLSKSDIIDYKNTSKKKLKISSKTGKNIDCLLTELSTEIKNIVGTNNKNIESLINKRHYALLVESKQHILRAISELKNNSTHDILAEILHEFLGVFNNISSPTSRNDIINNIFSNFCVGK